MLFTCSYGVVTLFTEFKHLHINSHTYEYSYVNMIYIKVRKSSGYEFFVKYLIHRMSLEKQTIDFMIENAGAKLVVVQ